MPKNGCFLLMAAVVFLLALPDCTVVQQQALYVSPFNGNNEDYHPLPQRTDSVHTAVYVQGSFFAGVANDKGTDYFSGGRAGIFVAHHFGLFQCYYGGDLSFGTYHLGRWDTSYTFLPFVARAIPPPAAGQLNQYAGPRTFGGYADRPEPLFRHFRSDDGNDRPDWLRRVWVSAGSWVGIELAYGQTDIYDDLSKSRLRYRYTSFCFHYTHLRYTGYLMVQTGAKASSFYSGFVYRLGRSRLPAQRHSLGRRLPPVQWR